MIIKGRLGSGESSLYKSIEPFDVNKLGQIEQRLDISPAINAHFECITTIVAFYICTDSNM